MYTLRNTANGAEVTASVLIEVGGNEGQDAALTTTLNNQARILAGNQDTPANTLTFSLDAGAPAGASIHPTTGVFSWTPTGAAPPKLWRAWLHPTTGAFSWTPTEAQGPGTFNVTVRVTDDGSPMQESFMQFTVQVNDDKPWQYFAEPLDVNVDGFISPLDALIIINDINARGPRTLPGSPSGPGPIFYLDANGDGSVSPIDALLVINRLNAPLTMAEGAMPAIAVASPVRQPLGSPHRSTYTLQSTTRETQAMPSHSLSVEQTNTTRHDIYESYDARMAEKADLEVALDMIVDDVAIALSGSRSLARDLGE